MVVLESARLCHTCNFEVMVTVLFLLQSQDRFMLRSELRKH